MEIGKSPFDVNINFRDIARAFGGWALDRVKSLAGPHLLSEVSDHTFEKPAPWTEEELASLNAPCGNLDFTGEPTLRMRRSAIEAELTGIPEVNPPTQPLVIQPRHGVFKGW